MKKDYKVKIKSIKIWNIYKRCYDYTNTVEALNYLVDVIASEKEFRLVLKKCKRDKLIFSLYCDDQTYEYIKMRFVCRQGKSFEWID